MNDIDIPADHGYPLRVICPGIVGARQVKWLTTIKTSQEESPSHWQKKDYRAFSPNVQIGDTPDFDSVPAIQEYPVQSAICLPSPNTKVSREEETVEVYGGTTWQSAELKQDPEQDLDHMWAWTLWKADIKIPKQGDKLRYFVKLLIDLTTLSQRLLLVCGMYEDCFTTLGTECPYKLLDCLLAFIYFEFVI
uniref:Oxidoreductase molybdopterin-binding domain-containing protein n=1 Tax=Ditylenchus dipsaci TaxID=166011 RepID=A0A915DTZ3_9BILA